MWFDQLVAIPVANEAPFEVIGVDLVACPFLGPMEFSRGCQSRPRKSGQGDKWSFCLTAGKINPRIRRDHEQTSAPDAHTGL